MSQLDEQLGAADARYTTCLEAGQPNNSQGGGGPGQNVEQAGDDDHDTDNMPGGPQQCGKEQGGQTFSAWIDGTKVVYPTVANGDCRLTRTDLTALKTLKGTRQPASRVLQRTRALPADGVAGAGGTTVITGLPLGPAQNILQDVELTEAIVFSGLP